MRMWFPKNPSETFISLPFLVTIAWAYYARNPLLILGYVSALPWLAFNLLALRDIPGHLDFYYAFPFWLALAWPLLAQLLWTYPRKTNITNCWPYFLLLVTSIFGLHAGHLVVYPFTTIKMTDGKFEGNSFVIREELGQRTFVRDFINYFEMHQELFEQSAMDEPVLGLVIDVNKDILWIGDWAHPPRS